MATHKTVQNARKKVQVLETMILLLPKEKRTTTFFFETQYFIVFNIYQLAKIRIFPPSFT